MTTKIKWRLSKLPAADEVALLMKDGILTKDEAREILFSQENDEDRDKESLKEEVKFLRELVQRLSSSSKIVDTIRYIEKPYQNYPWYTPYSVWAAGTGLNSGSNITYANSTMGGAGQLNLTASAGTAGLAVGIDLPFSSVQTF